MNRRRTLRGSLWRVQVGLQVVEDLGDIVKLRCCSVSTDVTLGSDKPPTYLSQTSVWTLWLQQEEEDVKAEKGDLKVSVTPS